jgi:hypothetical protein
MKQLITAVALAAAFVLPAYATSHKDAPDMADKKPTAQQSKMSTCNKEAGDKKGDERKAFMKECLSAKKATQQDKMKHCNAEAKDKTGDDRKAFMKDCLSSKG